MFFQNGLNISFHFFIFKSKKPIIFFSIKFICIKINESCNRLISNFRYVYD